MRLYMPCFIPHTGAVSPWRQPWPPRQQAHDARRSTTGKLSETSALQCLDRVCAWVGGLGGAVDGWVCYAPGCQSAKSANQRVIACVYVCHAYEHTARTHVLCTYPYFSQMLRRMSPARRWQSIMCFRCVGRAWRARNSHPRNWVQRPEGMSTSVPSLLLAVQRRGMGRAVGKCSRYTGNFRRVCACIVVYRVNMYHMKEGCLTNGDDIS